MDNLTHSLTGYMIGRTGLDRWCPRASLIAVVAANVPDIDFVSLAGGDLMVMQCHRAATHSFVWAPVVALLPLLLVAILFRKGMRWGRAWVVSLLAVVSHHLIDWTNIYGVRLFTPLDESWRRLDITSVIDLWIWAILLAFVGWMVLSKLVSGEIGAGKSSGAAAAIAALSLFALYDGARWFLHERAITVLDSRIYSGASASCVAAFPHFANPFRWTGLVETGNAYLLFDMNLLEDQFDPAGGRTFFKPRPSPAFEAASETEPFRVFDDFAEYPLWRLVPLSDPPGALQVQLTDLRFGRPGDGVFVATAIVDRNHRVQRAWYQYEPPGELPTIR